MPRAGDVVQVVHRVVDEVPAERLDGEHGTVAAAARPEPLISAIVPSGASAALDRVREHLDAGADHVVIQPLGADGGFAAGAVDELAAAVTELMKRSLRGEAYQARPTRRGLTRQPRAGRR